MRVVVVSAKGGVGKSTISLLLGKSLAELGEEVLIIDRDPLAYISNVFGVEGEGLVESVVEGQEPKNYVKTVGNLSVLKCYGQGPRYVVDMDKLAKSKELKGKACNNYMRTLLSRDYKFYIVDNPPLIFPEDPLVELELNSFLRVRPNEDVIRIYVSDPFDLSIRLTLEYLDRMEGEKPIGRPYAFIINLVPPLRERLDTAKEKVREIVSEKGLEEGVAIPFIEELFDLSSSDVRVPEELKTLALRIREKARLSS